MKRILVVGAVVGLLMGLAAPALAGGGPPDGLPGGDRARPVIYVESQGLYYDSIVGPALAMQGPFQELYMGVNGLTTVYGPGDQGFVGGRWWVDENGNGEMDAEDSYFSCPLLGPGRESP